MRVSYDAPRLPTLTARCELLQILAGAMVDAQVAEMSHDKDAYPCCVKCGDMAFRPVPGMTGSPGLPEEVPLMSDDQFEALISAAGTERSAIDREGGPGALRVQSARELSRSKLGHALELAIFQCAAERLRDKPGVVKVKANKFGNVHAYVAYDNGEIKNPQDDTVSELECGCGPGGGAHG